MPKRHVSAQTEHPSFLSSRRFLSLSSLFARLRLVYYLPYLFPQKLISPVEYILLFCPYRLAFEYLHLSSLFARLRIHSFILSLQSRLSVRSSRYVRHKMYT